MFARFEVFVFLVGVVVVILLFLPGYLNHAPATILKSDQIIGQVRHVVDGDSLYLKGYQPQIRLWGVDASEKGETGFHAAKNALWSFAMHQFLTCQIVDIDRYGRRVARCFLKNGREVNRLMIESGTATEYRRYSKGFYS